MPRRIRRVAILGAGLMGSQIAAHLANAGIPVDLLDIVPNEPIAEETKRGLGLGDREVRNRLALGALERLGRAKPSPIFGKEVLQRLRPGNFEDDLGRVADADWVIEAVVEELAAKRSLLERVEAVWRPGTIVSSNTSGISIGAMLEGRGESFRRHFLGTHFFNPPRYMKLLELVPGPETDPELIAFLREFAEHRLGKGVVIARDTPNFIANRLGTYGLQVTLQAMEEEGLGVDEVDELTGPLIGRPKSATFRTLDLVGLDTYVHVANNVRERSTDAAEQADFTVPAYLEEMVRRGWLGEKSGQGFYKKIKENGGSQILALDVDTLEYRPRRRASYASLEQAKLQPRGSQALAALLAGEDASARFTWQVLKRTLLYATWHLEEIAPDIPSVDRAMRWGFNWQQGPFELWQDLGLEQLAGRMQEEGERLPVWLEELLASGAGGFYRGEGTRQQVWQVGQGYVPLGRSHRVTVLKDLKNEGKVILSNPGASLVDLGDDVACLELHSPKDAIGEDVIRMIHAASEEVAKNWRGLVIANDGENFSVGANLMLILMEIQDDNWPAVEESIRQFQQANMTLKYLDRPVVAAPAGLALGGGVEICFGADRVQAAAETYMGLVEVGVGVLPGGGGTKEMLLRAMERVPEGSRLDPQPLIEWVFETIATAKVSTSAPEARQYGYLRDTDAISMNRDHRIQDAKEQVLLLDRIGYRPPEPKQVQVLGRDGRAALELGAYSFFMSGYASEHDRKIAGKIAHVLAGGDLPAGTPVSEEYLLDLEREAFLSLCGESKTQERMQHMLAKGKPLRN